MCLFLMLWFCYFLPHTGNAPSFCFPCILNVEKSKYFKKDCLNTNKTKQNIVVNWMLDIIIIGARGSANFIQRHWTHFCSISFQNLLITSDYWENRRECNLFTDISLLQNKKSRQKDKQNYNSAEVRCKTVSSRRTLN